MMIPTPKGTLFVTMRAAYGGASTDALENWSPMQQSGLMLATDNGDFIAPA